MSSSPTSPLPPPPSYPAPAISANDLSILPLKHLQYNLSSGSTNSFFVGSKLVDGTVSTASSPGGIRRASDVISQKREERELEVQDSFEDTLQETKERWSSFDDIQDEDDCYV